MSESLSWTYDDNSFAPSSCPLPANDTNPVTIPKQCRADANPWVHLDAHAEVKLKTRSRQGERSRNITFIEPMEKVVGWYRLFHDILVCRALEQMLALP